jgi:hypothetical protein
MCRANVCCASVNAVERYARRDVQSARVPPRNAPSIDHLSHSDGFKAELAARLRSGSAHSRFPQPWPRTQPQVLVAPQLFVHVVGCDRCGDIAQLEFGKRMSPLLHSHKCWLFPRLRDHRPSDADGFRNAKLLLRALINPVPKRPPVGQPTGFVPQRTAVHRPPRLVLRSKRPTALRRAAGAPAYRLRAVPYPESHTSKPITALMIRRLAATFIQIRIARVRIIIAQRTYRPSHDRRR